MRLACGTLGLALLAAAPAARNAADVVDRLERTVALPPNGLRVEATIADVTIVGSNRPDVAIEIVRRAPAAADLSRFPAVVEGSDPIRIAAVQPVDGRDPRLKSEIVIKAPATARLEAVRVFEGTVRISGLVKGCDVDIRRGVIEATGVAGRVRLESGIGRIDADGVMLEPGGMLRLRVFNGPVNVRFDRTPEHARILALTFHGTISSDIPLTMKDRFGPRFGEATLGSGDPVVSIDVVTGDISLRVRSR